MQRQMQVKTIDYSGQNIYAGIDVHKKSWNVSIFSEELHHKTFNQPPKPEALLQYLEKHFPNGTYYSTYEAGFCGFWIHEQLQSFGINNIVINPADVPTTDKEKKQKADPVDSRKLAKHLRDGNLEPIYTHRREILEDRGLLRLRRSLSRDIARYKNRIKSMLSFYGIEIPDHLKKAGSYWSNRFINWLSNLEFISSSGTNAFRVLVGQLKILRNELLAVTRKVRILSKDKYYQKRVYLLTSLPGIGLITAMIILTEIDNINRFKNQGKLASYIGLTPTRHSSGDKDIHGEMINRGNKYLKSALIESAWTAARVDPGLHLDYIKYCQRMKKNKAIVRIARKLLNRIEFVLKNKVQYNKEVN